MPHDANESYNVTLTFPNLAWQIVAFVCFTACLTIITALSSRRWMINKAFTKLQLSSSFWLCDICTALTYHLTWCFVVLNGFLTYGYGTNHTATCDASVTVCITVFVVSKVALYFFYLERTHVLASDGEPRFMGRFKNKQWLGGAVIFSVGVPCAILLGFSRKYKLVHRGGEAVGCHVGLKYAFATPLIVWAAILNTYLLVCYLLRFKTIYRKLAQRTSWAILVSGFSTVINLSVLLILQGEHGIECLLCCSIDMVANTLALAYCTWKEGEQAIYARDSSSSESSKVETPVLDVKIESHAF